MSEKEQQQQKHKKKRTINVWLMVDYNNSLICLRAEKIICGVWYVRGMHKKTKIYQKSHSRRS